MNYVITHNTPIGVRVMLSVHAATEHEELPEVDQVSLRDLGEFNATFTDGSLKWLGFRDAELRKVRNLIDREKFTEAFTEVYTGSREERWNNGYLHVPACRAFKTDENPRDVIASRYVGVDGEDGEDFHKVLIVAHFVDWIYPDANGEGLYIAPKALDLRQFGGRFATKY